MMVPPILSGTWCLATGSALEPMIVLKMTAMMALNFLIVVPARHLLRGGFGEHFVLGAAMAIVVHAALGAYQVIAFKRGAFPFSAIMATNPGMAMSAETTELYHEYVRRPFGLFAEPSAMAACIGPWLVLISHSLFSPRSGAAARKHTTLLALGLAAGLALLVFSQSGLGVAIVLAVPIPAIAAAFSARWSPIARGTALLLASAAVVGTTLWLLSEASSRFELAQNDSWQSRLASLEFGLEVLGSSSNILLGLGPGQMYPHLQSTMLRARAPGGITNIWSVALTYAIETGFIGLFSMLILGLSIAVAIQVSRARSTVIACALIWLTGLVVATSYLQQPALWTTLAVLLSWWSVAGARQAPQGSAMSAE